MKELIVGGYTKEKTVDAPDGPDGAKLDVFKDGRKIESVRLGGKEHGRRDGVGVFLPELGDPGLVAGFDEGNCQSEWGGNQRTRNGGKRGINGE